MSMPQQLPLRQDKGGDNNMMGGTNNYGGEQNILVEPIAFNSTNSHYGETHHNNHQHHQAGEDGDNHHVLPPLNKRHDSYNLPQQSFLGNVGQFTTTTTTTTRVTNTNYNTDVVGDASGDNSIDNNHNHTDHMNRRDSSFSDRRDSLLGLARRIHLLQDNETMSFNRRRGSMGSLSEGIPGATGGPSLLLMESEHDNAHIDIGGRDSDNNDEYNNNNSSINDNQNADSYGYNGSNQNGISNSNSHNNVFAKELAARAPTAQMLATEESKRLEENLMRLEMRRMMMMTQQQQQQQHQGNRQHQPQDNGNGNNNPTHQIYPARPQRVNETNYNTMNTMTTPAATTKNDAPIVMRQSNDQPQKMMAQQQFYNQGNFDQNQMMNWQQGINNTNYNNTNNTFFQQSHSTMNGYNMQTTATVPVAAQQDTATLPHNSIHNTYQQRQIQTQTQEPPPKVMSSAPRRPLSAYNIFFSEMRNKLLTEEGDESDNTCEQDDNNEDEEAPQTDDSKAEDKQGECGESATATDKNKQLESFADNLTKNYLNKDPKKRRAHRKTHGKVAFVSLAKMVGQKWRSLPEDEKKKYQDLAAVDQKRYKEEKMALAHALREEAKRMQKEGKMKGF